KYLSFKFFFLEANDDFICLIDYVVVGNNYALRIDYKSGPEALSLKGFRLVWKETSEEIMKRIVFPKRSRPKKWRSLGCLDSLCCRNIDDRRLCLGYNICKRGKERFLARLWLGRNARSF